MLPFLCCPRFRTSTSGFSLVELSVVVAILSIVAALGLEGAANFVNKTSSAVTREKVVAIDDAIVRFFRIYGRLPCPAARATAQTATTYGNEDCTIAATTGATTGSNMGGGTVYGTVPFRALNLPMETSIDGFGRKINYVVTKNLTAAGTTSGRFGAASGTTVNDGAAGIEIRTGILEQPCTSSKCQVVANPYSAGPPITYEGAAYVIFSNGADRRGSYNPLGTLATACIPSPNASYNTRVDTQNCIFTGGSLAINASVTAAIPVNVFYDNRINNGLNLKSFFDDIVIWRTKAQL